MKKSIESIWETRNSKRENGSVKRLMICQNSNPTVSKWGDYCPEDGPCDEWVEVGEKTTATLCWKCTARTVNL
jgi:hypothetical protein